MLGTHFKNNRVPFFFKINVHLILDNNNIMDMRLSYYFNITETSAMQPSIYVLCMILRNK
jgi:membrane-bound metal-dependent hydrolase YbcI (DUF457 family)